MKTKLTLTVDAELLPQVKRIAVLKGTSVSQIVEDGMRNLVQDSGQTFAKKWRGKLKESLKNDERYEYLAKKYL